MFTTKFIVLTREWHNFFWRLSNVVKLNSGLKFLHIYGFHALKTSRFHVVWKCFFFFSISSWDRLHWDFPVKTRSELDFQPFLYRIRFSVYYTMHTGKLYTVFFLFQRWMRSFLCMTLVKIICFFAGKIKMFRSQSAEISGQWNVHDNKLMPAIDSCIHDQSNKIAQ